MDFSRAESPQGRKSARNADDFVFPLGADQFLTVMQDMSERRSIRHTVSA
jgi:hypothetical protein